MPDKCAVCGKEIHSITTRRIGDFTLCINCGDSLSPLVEGFSNNIVKGAAAAVAQGIKIENYALFITLDMTALQYNIKKGVKP